MLFSCHNPPESYMRYFEIYIERSSWEPEFMKYYPLLKFISSVCCHMHEGYTKISNGNRLKGFVLKITNKNFNPFRTPAGFSYE